jgi:hypothetical protein
VLKDQEGGTKIVVYADRTEFFTKLFDDVSFFSCEKIEAHQLVEYRGAIDFTHRVKIRLLQEFIRTRSGNVIYVDSDTVFVKEPSSLVNNVSQGAFALHLKEEGDRDAPQTLQFLRKLDDLVARGELSLPRGPAPSSVAMWNAGVIGLNSKHASVLDEVLAMTDAIFPLTPEKPDAIRWLSEQYAFSYIFQARGCVVAATECIYHYWGRKNEFRSVLTEFFAHGEDRPLAAMIDATTRILPQNLYRSKVEQHRLSSLRKLVRKLRGMLGTTPS